MREVQHRQDGVGVVLGRISTGVGDIFALSLDWLAGLQAGNFMRQPLAVAETHSDEYFRADQVLRSFELQHLVDPDDEVLMIGVVVELRVEEHLADRALHASERRALRPRGRRLGNGLRRAITHEISGKTVRWVYGET